MKQQLQNLVYDSLKQLSLEENSSCSKENILIEKTRDRQHGDFSSNIAMVLAKPLKQNPRDLAGEIINKISDSDFIDRIEVAGPGFINFFLKQNAYHFVVNEILTKKDSYGCSDFGQGYSVLVEFVSANPTGPLHIGHGRGAAYGEVVSSLLKAIGYRVEKEYYVNDAGRQIDILALSIWLRYLEMNNVELSFPEKAYQGDYIANIASELQSSRDNKLVRDISTLESGNETDPDRQLDIAIQFMKSALDEDEYEYILDFGLKIILDGIRNDLEAFGITCDNWFSERSLVDNDDIAGCIAALESSGEVYTKDGAKWFRSTG